jgi:hypothetical protein
LLLVYRWAIVFFLTRLVFAKQFKNFLRSIFALVRIPFTEEEGSVQLTSLYELVYISCFWYCEHLSYLDEEVKCIETSLSVRIPCFSDQEVFIRKLFLHISNIFNCTSLTLRILSNLNMPQISNTIQYWLQGLHTV